ncbi:MAG TPA: hypothetical protein VMG82_22785 [Candidatus Sulfotelmatobacter sp.]|nr:hypothetical protein [Candidatus Sulfotelmatobacter sp.]
MSAFPDNPNGAILHSTGQGVLVNGNSAPASAAIFANDLIQTQKAYSARIEVTGSAATIDPETVVQFEPEELALDHGSLSVYTRTGLRVRIGCITITPVNPSNETLYEVTDRDGQVTVHASRNDVHIDAKTKESKDVQAPSRSKHDLVREGEQKSREEKCAGAAMKAQSAPGIDGIMNSRWALIGGGIAAGLVTCLGLCHDDDPISPWKP